MLPFNKKIGILGGGQLGKMLIESSLPLNVTFNILENDQEFPSMHLAGKTINGKLTDGDAIMELAAISDILTYEIEHVNVDILEKLSQEGKTVIPSPSILRIIQDKGLQKKFYAEHGIPTSPFTIVSSPAEWVEGANSMGFEKFVAKKCTEGYDGRGVAIVETDKIRKDINAVPFKDACVLEGFVDCKKELSVIVARNIEGEVKTFPLVEMVFDPQANLVDYLSCPAQIDEETEEYAKAVAIRAVELMEGVGIFAVELFLTSENKILVNEIAPRPHNSGHHTIEACYTSQYQQFMRILMGLPLGNTDLIKPAVMINLLGNPGFHGTYQWTGLDEILEMQGVYLHLYNKKETRPKRKMGHITVLGDTLDEAIHKAQRIKQIIGMVHVSA